MSFPLEEYEQFAAAGRAVGRAVVTQIWGSAPRSIGACMIATADGAIAGSVSGGCVENAVALDIAAVIASGQARTVTYGVSDETAWGVGLSCGGSLSVYVEPSVRPVVPAAATTRNRVVATIVDPPQPVPTGWSIGEAGDATEQLALADAVLEALTGEVELAARRALAHGASDTVVLTTSTGLAVTVLLEVFPRQPTLLLVGGVHVAQALMSLARPLGYRTVVADGRAGWLTRERFPDADRLLCAWPEEAFAEVGIDSSTCICLLSHDPKFDEPAMRLALRSPAAYVGAIGSRKTQASRRARLLEEGFTPDELARLHGPIGLDLGGREPMDTALAIMAEIAAARHGASGGFLSRRPAP